MSEGSLSQLIGSQPGQFPTSEVEMGTLAILVAALQPGAKTAAETAVPLSLFQSKSTDLNSGTEAEGSSLEDSWRQGSPCPVQAPHLLLRTLPSESNRHPNAAVSCPSFM